jgi:hypothetical protein
MESNQMSMISNSCRTTGVASFSQACGQTGVASFSQARDHTLPETGFFKSFNEEIMLLSLSDISFYIFSLGHATIYI